MNQPTREYQSPLLAVTNAPLMKVRDRVLMIQKRGEQFVSQTVVDGQVARRPPTILRKKAVALLEVVNDSGRCERSRADVSQEEVRHAQTSVSSVDSV